MGTEAKSLGRSKRGEGAGRQAASSLRLLFVSGWNYQNACCELLLVGQGLGLGLLAQFQSQGTSQGGPGTGQLGGQVGVARAFLSQGSLVRFAAVCTCAWLPPFLHSTRVSFHTGTACAGLHARPAIAVTKTKITIRRERQWLPSCARPVPGTVLASSSERLWEAGLLRAHSTAEETETSEVEVT